MKSSGRKWVMRGLEVIFVGVAFAVLATYLPAFSRSLKFENENKTVTTMPGLNDALKLQDVYRTIARSVMPAVVSINTESIETVQNPLGNFFNDPFFQQFFGEEGRGNMPKEFKRKLQGLGSGFIVTPDGYIFTNHHVVKDASKIMVVLSDNRRFRAKVVGTDPETDFALLKIKAAELPVVAMGDSAVTQVGDFVMAIGNPFGLTGTFTSGIISFVGRSGMISGFQRFIQTDAPVNPGNSGGPLVNLRGQVVGINTAIQTETGGYQGISFALPINTAQDVAEQLIGGGRIERGYLGVEIAPLDASTRSLLGLKDGEGVLLSKVNRGGPGDKAGLHQGDVVIKVNGKSVGSVEDLQVAIGGQKPGSPAALEIIRNKKSLQMNVKLGERPKTFTEAGTPGEEGNHEGTNESYEFKGVTFMDAGEDLLKANQADYGVLVTGVQDDSPWAEVLDRGLIITAINDTEIHNLKDLKAFAAHHAKEETYVFRIVKNGSLYYRGVEK